MRNKPKLSTVFLNGIITENPTFRQVLGICPTIAVTSGLINAIGMGKSFKYDNATEEGRYLNRRVEFIFN